MAYNNRGVSYFLQNMQDKAFEDYTKAIELDNNNSEAYINRAYVHLRNGNQSFAISDLQKGCDLGNNVGCDTLHDVLRNK
jgi:tetratricopeptide (TPR) repeat protein